MEHITYKEIQGLLFCVYTKDEIKKFSALEVTNPETFDILGHPTAGGLHDPSLGPNERDDICTTCGLGYFECPGHVGHITLPLPVYSPVFLSKLYQLLRGSCFYCHRLVANPGALYLTLYQLKALDYGLVSLAQELEETTLSEAYSADVSVDESTDVIQQKLKSKVDEATIGLSRDGKQSSLVKSVVECRRNIVKRFIREHMMGSKAKCPYCMKTRKKVALIYNTNFVVTGKDFNLETTALECDDEEDTVEITEKNDVIKNEQLTPLEVKKHLHMLWENEKVLLQQLYKTLCSENSALNHPTDMFFMELVVVPPIKFRQVSVVRGRKFLNPQSAAMNEVLKDGTLIRTVLRAIKQKELDAEEQDAVNKSRGNTIHEKLRLLWSDMQQDVNEIFDSDLGKFDKNKIPFGIKQILEKKDGLFRKNMMGKRVNFAARSVISPDPYIMVNEIGVPLVFAKKLTFPEPVSHWNVEKLRQAVNNGPKVHPGAILVESETGKIIKLSDTDVSSRRMIANTLLTPPASGTRGAMGVKKVHRHLRNGDMLLLNRQPTLHKTSIMAHKARILPGDKTLRLHYANCKSYNADFDGDEMNAHFPQSIHGQAECEHIVNVNHQYLVPKDGTPLSGLIQDHIIAGTLLTIRGRFFSRADYHQLMYSAISFKQTRLKLLPPSIIKPKLLWSGKQIVSSIIINLIPEGRALPSITGKTKVSGKNWQNAPRRKCKYGGTPLIGDDMSESEVIISSGELLCGVIDKAQVGPTPYSLIHCCYELYGGETSTLLLTALARLFTHYLQYHSGFSLGIEDIMLTEEATLKREEIISRSNEEGEAATCAAFEIDPKDIPHAKQRLLHLYKEAYYSKDDSGMKILDFEMKKITDKLNNEINEACVPNGLIKKFPMNNLQLMVQSGAKGSSVNAMQISGLLGQIELEGRRMPLMMNGCTLPSFLPFDTSPSAGGFVAGRFLTGINHQEFFFHCMAGREGLIDTAVKTSRSGYLQRCLIKHLEGIMVNYDLTVRDSDGSVIQFLYGEDGLDILKNQLLKENRLHLLANNYEAAVNEDEIKQFVARQTDENPEYYKKKIRKWVKKHGESTARQSPFNLFENSTASHEEDFNDRKSFLSSEWNELDESNKEKFKKKVKRCPDPVNSFLRPNLCFGSVTEKLESIITDYLKKNPHGLLVSDAVMEELENHPTKKYLSKSKFQSMAYYRALRALAEPGEAVGLLCAQSIGEPSTQMTLNTFHFAGKGEMNVTLGIPRLREILMTASPNIATPTMDLPLLDVPDVESKAERLRIKLTPVALKDILESVEITEKVIILRNADNIRSCSFRMKFLKHSEYKGDIDATPSKILYYIEHVFIRKFVQSVRKKQGLRSSTVFVRNAKDAKDKSEAFYISDPQKEDAETEATEIKAANEESSDESDGEGDTVSTKTKNRHEQDQEYEDPEEEEELPESESEETEKEPEIKEEVKSEDEDVENVASAPVPNKYQEESRKKDRIHNVKTLHNMISDYDYDIKHERWCEFTLASSLKLQQLDMKTLMEDEINNAYVSKVTNIQEVLLVKNPKAKGAYKMMLKTKGVNFLEVFRYENILDINKVYSNNIHAIAHTYGIEAAAKAIVNEVVNVFALYGIQVDLRHLTLLADYMTSSGTYRACNRIGMESNASPLQQMTFETTKNYMVEAMLTGAEDKLKSPSASIVLGQLVGSGTGCFSLRSSGRISN